MRLKVAVDEYIKQRRANGSPFVSSAATLNAFCTFCGDIDLDEVSDRISLFMKRPGRAPITKVSVFSGIRCFVRHYVDLGRMAPCMLTAPAHPAERRVPRIYTPAQVSQLLLGARACRSRAVELDAGTFRLALLLLYATGATVSEILGLRRSDVHLRDKKMRLCAGHSERWIPFGAALDEQLALALRALGSNDLVCGNRAGMPLSRKYLCSRFRKLTRLVGIEDDASGRAPRLQDMRYTFAVHRLENWIRQRKDLNTFIPALSTYMGYADLLKAEEFLAFAPERFRSDLDKLSPKKTPERWRDNAPLLAFLDGL